jgi:hypothetical protein
VILDRIFGHYGVRQPLFLRGAEPIDFKDKLHTVHRFDVFFVRHRVDVELMEDQNLRRDSGFFGDLDHLLLSIPDIVRVETAEIDTWRFALFNRELGVECELNVWILQPLANLIDLLLDSRATKLHVEDQQHVVLGGVIDIFLNHIGIGIDKIGTVVLGFALRDRGDHLKGEFDRTIGIGFLIGMCLANQFFAQLWFRVFPEDAHEFVARKAVVREDAILREDRFANGCFLTGRLGRDNVRAITLSA